jgi:ubiquinone/menaquinone biosynthesis C-methylase UbiE
MVTGEESWLPDERRTAGRENLDPVHVARYDEKEDADCTTEVSMLRSLGVDESSTVVDLGAGTGQFALAIAPHVQRVVAVDVSAVMLTRLGAKLDDTSLANVERVEAGFLTYRHTGEPADVVYSRYALHHLPDFWKAVALTRAASMLQPGGLLRLWDVVWSFDLDDTDAALQRWFGSLPTGNIEADWTRAELEEHVRDEHSTFTWLLEPMLERSGFTIEAASYSDDQIFARYLCRRR